MVNFRIKYGCTKPAVVLPVSPRMVGEGRSGLEAWDWREAADALEVPPAKFGRLITLQDAVRNAARNWPGGTRSTV